MYYFIPKENYCEYASCNTLSDALLCITSGNGEVDVVEFGKYYRTVKYTYIVRDGVVVGRQFEHPIFRGRLKSYYFG